VNESLPILLIPGLMCSARLYGPQIPALWPHGPVSIANHRFDDSMAAIARRILATAPPRFAAVGLSMGGIISFEIWRQAPERVAKLALLDTNARNDAPSHSARRDEWIAMAEGGRYRDAQDEFFKILVHADRLDDPALKRIAYQMGEETGPEAFVRQQRALKARPDSRPDLPTINCPTLVLVGDGDELTPPLLAEEIASGIPNSRLVVVADCGHLSTLERPEAVNAALVDWLQW
jgi:pimeloyl-ACP methyl ester carboxylesterase